jgi:cyclophilin family peptidyl-prolyl cis-trans isomerase
MRSTTRTLAALLAVLSALFVAGCGDDDEGTTSAAAPTSAATTATTPATTGSTAAATETEPAATSGTTTADAASAASEPAPDTTAAGSSASEPDSAAATDEAGPADVVPVGQTGADGCNHDEPPAAGGDRRTYDAPPPSGLRDGALATVRFETSCGTILIELDREVGGAVTEAFAGLVRDGFYDGLTFHRVVPDFVLQGGDPEGTGGGGPGFEVTQAPPSSYVYARGDVAMAKLATDPAGTAGSQFFVVSSPQGAAALGQPGQPPLYAVVGHVLDQDSLETVARIGALGIADGPPVEPVWIWRATLEEG